MPAESSSDISHSTTRHNGRNMKRLDSVVDDTHCWSSPRPPTNIIITDNARIQRSRPPTSRTKTGRSSTSTERESSRMTPTSLPGQTFEVRRDSLGSSGASSSSKARRHRSGSKRSSRTAYSLQDPTRPPLPYRINSSPAVATSRRDVDDVLALHYRSCTLFSRASTMNTPAISKVKAQSTRSEDIYATAPQPDEKSTSAPALPETGSNDRIDDICPVEIPSTVNYWTSTQTRRKEYEAIDKDNRGISGFFRRVIPKWCPGSQPSTFYEKDSSDVGSVRRYRLDLPDESDDEFEHDEKEANLLQRESKKTKRNGYTVSHGWNCF